MSTEQKVDDDGPMVEYRDGGWWCANCDATYPTASRFAWHDCPDR